jgi:hypothetical protein
MSFRRLKIQRTDWYRRRVMIQKEEFKSVNDITNSAGNAIRIRH